VAGLASAVAAKYVPKISEFKRFQAILHVWLAANVTGDIIITSVLVFYLVRRLSPLLHNSNSKYFLSLGQIQDWNR
jgi:hypothetical protein